MTGQGDRRTERAAGGGRALPGTPAGATTGRAEQKGGGGEAERHASGPSLDAHERAGRNASSRRGGLWGSLMPPTIPFLLPSTLYGSH